MCCSLCSTVLCFLVSFFICYLFIFFLFASFAKDTAARKRMFGDEANSIYVRIDKRNIYHASLHWQGLFGFCEIIFLLFWVLWRRFTFYQCKKFPSQKTYIFVLLLRPCPQLILWSNVYVSLFINDPNV